MPHERIANQIGRGVLWFTDRQTNRRPGRRQAGQQRTQLLKWVGLELRQT